MSGRVQGARTNRLREVPLEQVAVALGYRHDKRDRARWKRQGSVLGINGSRFYDHLQGRGGGGAIDLVIHVRQCGFLDALGFLSGLAAIPQQQQPTGLQLPDPVEHLWPRVRGYLTTIRRLDPDRLDDGHRCGQIYADNRRNAVFVARDSAGVATGAELFGCRSMSGRRFKGMAPGSRKARGGFWLNADNAQGGPASVLLVESAVDALAAVTLSLQVDLSVIASTAGVATNIPPWLEAFRPKRILCGYDNDKAGELAAQALARKDPRVTRCRPQGAKDWNDML